MNLTWADEEDPKLKENLTPGASEQIAPVPQAQVPPQVDTPQLKPATSVAAPMPAAKLPGMPPGIGPDQLAPYIQNQKSSMSKFGPQQQMDLEKQLANERNSLGYKLTDAGKGLSDAIMQGVAEAGNPGNQERFENQQMAQGQEKLGVMQKAHEENNQDTETKMKLDMMDAKSPISQSYRQAFAPIFQKMGYPPQAIANMPASQVQTVAELGVKFADVQTQLELKKALLGVETFKTTAQVQNSQQERRQDALKQLSGMPWYSRVLHPDVSSALSQHAGLDAPSGTAHPQAAEALEWAKENPGDKRSAQILKRLGH